MADINDQFVKALTTSAAIDAAKYGGYSPIDLNTLQSKSTGKFGGLLDVLLPMYAAATNAPAAKMAMAGRQAYNLHQYNKQAQAQALYALQQEALKNTNNATIYNKRTGMNIQGPFDVTLADSAAPDIRKDNATPSINDLLRGEALKLAPNADYDPALIRDYLTQQAAANNYVNRGMAGEAVQEGQGLSSIGKMLQKTLNLPPQQGAMDGGRPPLTAGASISVPGKTIDPNSSPYLYPTDIPDQYAGLLKAGMNDTQTAAQQKETNRHNQATEAQQARELQERINHGYWAPNGGSGNPFTVPNAMQTNLNNQINAIKVKKENQLAEAKRRGFLNSDGSWKTGFNIEDNPGYKEIKHNVGAFDIQMADLSNQISGKPAPFGGQSGQKIRAAGSSLTGEKAEQSKKIYPGKRG